MKAQDKLNLSDIPKQPNPLKGVEMLKKVLSYGLLGGSVVLMSNCASLSSFQDAKTLEKGKASVLVAVTKYTEKTSDANQDAGLLGLDKFWALDGALRLGVMDHLDAGLKYTLPGGIVVDGKYNFLGADKAFAISSGFKVGYMQLETSGSDSSKASKYTTLDFTVPVYASSYFTDWLCLTLTPDFTFRSQFGTDVESRNFMLAGANANFKLGKNKGVLVEGGYHMPLDDSKL
jgi:hypothetical protein